MRLEAIATRLEAIATRGGGHRYWFPKRSRNQMTSASASSRKRELSCEGVKKASRSIIEEPELQKVANCV